jgi:hypothetical protein
MAATDTNRKYLNAERASEALDPWRSSCLSLKEFANSQGLSETTLTRWQRRLTATSVTREVASTFVQMQPIPVGEVTVHAPGVSIQIPAALLAHSLPTILQALRC